MFAEANDPVSIPGYIHQYNPSQHQYSNEYEVRCDQALSSPARSVTTIMQSATRRSWTFALGSGDENAKCEVSVECRCIASRIVRKIYTQSPLPELLAHFEPWRTQRQGRPCKLEAQTLYVQDAQDIQQTFRSIFRFPMVILTPSWKQSQGLFLAHRRLRSTGCIGHAHTSTGISIRPSNRTTSATPIGSID
jgi:hypothetical protein